MSESQPATLPRQLVWVLVVLTLGWGINWPMMKTALTEMPPLHFRAMCLLGGAVGVFPVAWLGGHRLSVPRERWGRLVVVSILNMAAWNLFAAYGIPMLATGRAAIFAYSMPIWAIPISAVVLGEPVNRRRLLGLALGMAGMALLLGEELSSVGRSPLGAVLMLSAAISWAFAIVIMKRWPVDLPGWSFTAWQLLIAGVPVTIAALTFEHGTFFPWQLSLWPGLAALYTVVISFWICQWAFITIALRAPVGVSSIATLMTPVVGVFSAAVLLGERPHWQDYAALALVFAALATVLPLPRFLRLPGSFRRDV